MAASLLLVMVSCSQEEMPLRQDDNLFSQEVTTYIPKSKARTRLAKFLTSKSVGTRAFPASIDEGIAIGKDRNLLTRGDEQDAWYYYFSINNGEQFAIMGAKPEMPDLLAFGNGTPSWEDETSFVPNPERWDIGNLVPIDTTPQIAVPDSIITVYGDMCFPDTIKSTPTYLCPVTWDQDAPFNKFCPPTKEWPDIKANAGCVPLAVLQMFAAEGIRPAAYKDFVINWDLLLSCPTKQSMIDNNVASDHAAELMMILGNDDNLKVSYSSNGQWNSTADPWYITPTLSNFGFSNPGNYVEYSKETRDSLNADLSRGYPVIMGGHEKGVYEGHQWLVHGMIRGYREVRHYSALTGAALPEYEVQVFYFYQINWGWGGRADGYYIETGFEPGHPDYLNPDNNPPYPGQNGINYGYSRKMQIGVQK